MDVCGVKALPVGVLLKASQARESIRQIIFRRHFFVKRQPVDRVQRPSERREAFFHRGRRRAQKVRENEEIRERLKRHGSGPKEGKREEQAIERKSRKHFPLNSAPCGRASGSGRARIVSRALRGIVWGVCGWRGSSCGGGRASDDTGPAAWIGQSNFLPQSSRLERGRRAGKAFAGVFLGPNGFVQERLPKVSRSQSVNDGPPCVCPYWHAAADSRKRAAQSRFPVAVFIAQGGQFDERVQKIQRGRLLGMRHQINQGRGDEIAAFPIAGDAAAEAGALIGGQPTRGRGISIMDRLVQKRATLAILPGPIALLRERIERFKNLLRVWFGHRQRQR